MIFFLNRSTKNE